MGNGVLPHGPSYRAHPRLYHRDKSQSPEFTVGIDAKRTFVDKRSRPNLQRMTHLRHNPASEPTEIRRCSLVAPNPRCAILWFGLEFTSKGVGA
jgi:hypothetical protein